MHERRLKTPLCPPLPVVVLFLAGALACKGGDRPAEGSEADPPAEAPRAAEAPAGGSADDAPAPAGGDEAAPAAEAGGHDGAAASGEGSFDRATLCTDSCLLLTQHRYDDVADKIYCQQCRQFDDEACTLDWPFSDFPPCEEWDRMRNCIYAGFGYSFKKDRWKKEFASKPWYRPDPAFEESKLPRVARGNVAYLKEVADQCRKSWEQADR